MSASRTSCLQVKNLMFGGGIVITRIVVGDIPSWGAAWSDSWSDSWSDAPRIRSRALEHLDPLGVLVPHLQRIECQIKSPSKM